MADPLVAVLAAGRGERFGGGKLDARCAGKPLGCWALEAVAAAGLSPGVIVTGPVPPAFAARSGWTIRRNPDAARGLATSLACAAAAGIASDADLLVVLADMPLVAPDHLRTMAAMRGVVATRQGDGCCGVPARFPRHLLAELGAARGEGGAGRWLARRRDTVALVPQDGSLLDVDTPGALARAEAILRARA